MSTRSGRLRPSAVELSPPRTRKGVSPVRSPARTRKSSPPARSPSRKSPSRKSPSRKSASKFPARKSPSRTTKDTPELIIPKSPARRSAIKPEVNTKLEDVSTKVEVYRSTRSRRIEYSIKDITGVNQSEVPITDKINGLDSIFDSIDINGPRNRKPVEEDAPRRSSRLRDLIDNVPDIRRSLSKSVSKSLSKSVSKSLDTLSDGENSEEEFQRKKYTSVTRKLATPLREIVGTPVQFNNRWEFGGRIGSIALLFLIPLTVFTILISCRKLCSLQSLLDLTPYKSLSAWFGIQSTLLFIGQVIIQAIFAIIPIFGKKAERMDGIYKKYCFNALFSCIATCNMFFALDYFNIYHSSDLLNEYLRLAVVSYIFAVILSIILYVKSLKIDSNDLNPYGNTGYVLYDFFMGREIHPFIKKLDVKIWISRISNINALVLAVLIFKGGIHLQITSEDIVSDYKQLLNKVQLQPTILLYSLMQISYILSFIIREYRITTTFYWQSEGVGYLQIVSSALYPFYFITISKFVAESDLSLSTNALITASIFYVLGFFVMLISNNIKYEFRRNPLHPSLAYLDSMPTFHGKKLLVSGLWGVLRHPNYAGDILIHIALALPGLLSCELMACAPALLTVAVLLHRARRDHLRCTRRYGAAWQRYCNKVKSLLIPKVL